MCGVMERRGRCAVYFSFSPATVCAHLLRGEGLVNVNTSTDLWFVGTFSALFHSPSTVFQ